jgi:hypothetical protein
LGVFVEELPYLGKILFYKTPYEGKMFQRKGQNERAWQTLLAFGKEVWYNKKRYWQACHSKQEHNVENQ